MTFRFNMARRPKPRSWRGQTWRWAQAKLDGHRYTIMKANGRVKMIGRKEDQDIWPKMEDHLGPLVDQLSMGTVLDGELLVPGDHATSVSRWLADPDLRPGLVFNVFAMPFLAGCDVRERDLPEVMSIVRAIGFETPQTFLRRELEDMDEFDFHHLAQHLGIEGFILKNESYEDWYKVKHTKSVDAIIMEVKPGTPGTEFAGLLGSLVVGLYQPDGSLQAIANVPSGYSLADRALDWSPRIGQVCEVKYQELGSQGRLKFPTFLRMREDKPPQECTMEQLS